MPYNTTAIPPRKEAEATGQTQLPLSRVKKIIGTDPDIAICSNNAAFVITLAAEMFVQHLASAAHDATKLDSKPRKNIQYKDIANAVAANDNLEFLEDVVPKTHTYKSIRQKAQETRAKLNSELGIEDKPLSNGKKQKLQVNGSRVMNVSRATDEQSEDANAQLEWEASQAAGEDVPMKD